MKATISASAIAKKNNSSIIFNEQIAHYIQESKAFSEVQKQLYEEMLYILPRNIFIYTNKMSSMIHSKNIIPIMYAFHDKNDEFYQGIIPYDIQNRNALDNKDLTIIQETIKQINQVLPEIVPNLSIRLINLGNTMNDDGKIETLTELVSIRNQKEIPLRCESDGIIKIISVLSALIMLYGAKRAIVLIDELDSGVFEYLLGEILEILSTGAKGQLIFTSHNLRALEILPAEKNSIYNY